MLICRRLWLMKFDREIVLTLQAPIPQNDQTLKQFVGNSC